MAAVGLSPVAFEDDDRDRARRRDLDPAAEGDHRASLFAFILGDVLGAGIYALMGVLSEKVGGMLWAPLLLALLLAMLTAGSYAELVTNTLAPVEQRSSPSAPSTARWCRSWSDSACSRRGVTSAAGLAIAFAGDYLGTFLDLPTIPVAIAFLALVGLLNARGIRESMGANLVMTAIELSGLVIVVAVVAIFVGGGGGDLSRVTEAPEGTNAAIAVLSGAVIAYYSFVGFETSANMIEEVKDPRRMYPRALFGRTVHRRSGLRAGRVGERDRAPARSTAGVERTPARRRGGHRRQHPLLAVQPHRARRRRQRRTADDDHGQPPDLRHGRAEPPARRPRPRAPRRGGPPGSAILTTTLVAMGLTLVGDLATLAETVVLLLLVVFLSVNVSVLVLRRDRVENDHFRVWTFVPVLGIGSASCC